MPTASHTARRPGMMRIKRAPEARRAEFLDCAQALFFTRGYDATTVNDIIDRAGLSKGAFYHYFDSKEALLDALTERLIAQVIEEARPILDDAGRDALARFNDFMEQGRQWKVEQAPMLRALYAAILQPQNVILRQRIIATSSRLLGPVMADLVSAGAREGVFTPVAPALVAEVILAMGDQRMAAALDAMAEAAAGALDTATARLEARLDDEAAVIERLLGVPRGAVRLVEPGFVRAILSALV